MTILDTNVVSETMKPAPSAKVMAWLAAQPSDEVYLTALTQAEILLGSARLPLGRRRTFLETAWQMMLEQLYIGRVLPFDSAAAHQFARIAAGRRRAGRPISQTDAQIAAIARSVGAAIATRNARDFAYCGVKVLNPWA